ncbi:MAG: Octanoyltransferase [Candidatus Heimdallarchaeota archaeon LC_2]|nr:MAG: Octanoyltransferase [Candidatus Heimdallarchaeota archaeon LC_2]
MSGDSKPLLTDSERELESGKSIIQNGNKEAKLVRRSWVVQHFDKLKYQDALLVQQNLHDKVKTSDEHYLLLLQHYPVITMGRRTDASHILLSESELEERNIELYRVNRGGSATYHGPGQLIGYLICKSSRYGGIHSLVSIILKTIHEVISSFGIKAKIDEENPGVWTDTEPPRKLSAVGMSNKDGYTMHGFAINVDLPLTGFSTIVPCGLTLPVSTLAIESGKRIKISEVEDLIKTKLLFNLK